MCVHFQIIYYVEKYGIRIIVMFFTKAGRTTRPHFTQVWQKPLVMALLTLTLSIYSAPLNGILCSACAYSTQKYQMCWCEQKKKPKKQNPCSQSSMQVNEKTVIQCTFTGHTASAVLVKTNFLFAENKKMTLWDKYLLWFFFFRA